MTFTPRHVKHWIEKINYIGRDYSQYYLAAYRHYRCSPFERDTFAHIRDHLHDLGAEASQVIDVTCSDALLQARFYVLVHQDFERGLKAADMFAQRLWDKGTLLPENDYTLEVHADERPFNAADVTGHFAIVPGTNTTFTSRRKRQMSEKHEAARDKVVKEIECLTGAPVALYARALDGIQRRWSGVKSHQADA